MRFLNCRPSSSSSSSYSTALAITSATLAAVATAQPYARAGDSSSPAAPTVTVSSGAISGITTQIPTSNTTVHKFLGVPFAAAPVGDLRFDLPQPPPVWGNTTVLNATAYGSACMQANEASTLLVGQSEDCLYLNIFAPATPTPPTGPDSGGRVVMVWIHGGGLVAGSAAEADFDGSSFAAHQDVIIVTINYRLNVFGFVNTPALPLTSQNLGLYDQRQALAWVRDEIAAFGGDPDKVTVFGESSGSTSVSRLVETMVEDTPFRAAIMESGWVDTTPFMNEYDVYGPDAWDTLVAGINCTSASNSTADEFACVKAADAETIYEYLNINSGVLFTAISDNVTEYSAPYYERLRGNIAKVPIMTGTNAQEGTLWTTSYTLDEEIEQFPELAPIRDALAAAYVVGGNDSAIPNGWYANAALDTDAEYVCPTSLATSQTVDLGVPVWRYYYNATFPNTDSATDYAYPVVNGYGAYHSAEIPLVWGTYSAINATAEEIALSKVMQKAWADFAKDPYGTGPGWPRYDSNSSEYQIAALGSPDLNPVGWSMIPNTTLDGNCWIYQPLYEEYQGGIPWW